MPNKVIILVFALILTGCTSQPIKNIDGAYIPELQNSENKNLTQIEKTIIVAALKRGWNPKVVSPGLIEADLKVRDHSASVTIEYDENAYSITYKNSSNLNYKDGKIHRNYNKWIHNLSETIRKELILKLHSN